MRVSDEDYTKYENLSYQKFRELARSDDLSRHQKVGFPNEYREGKEKAIFRDILEKLPIAHADNLNVLDIGPGCSNLPLMLADVCQVHGHSLFMIDSEEMLEHIPVRPFLKKIVGRFPEVPDFLSKQVGKMNMILAYSVIQYPFEEGGFWAFFDQALSLMSDGASFLIGDIPNSSMRKRFFSSEQGVRFHQQYTGRKDRPDVHFNSLDSGLIDDSIVLAMLARARAAGFHAWVVRQSEDLPMANRREDVLIYKP